MIRAWPPREVRAAHQMPVRGSGGRRAAARGVVRSSGPQVARHRQALLTELSSSSPPFREPLRRAEGSRPFIAPGLGRDRYRAARVPVLSSAARLPLARRPRRDVGGIEHRHLCLVHGPGRIVQRGGRVILRPLGVVLGRLRIVLLAFTLDASLQLGHLGRSVGLDRLPLGLRLIRLAVNSSSAALALALALATRALICSFVSCREASSELLRSATLACRASICSDNVMSFPLPSAVPAGLPPSR